MMNETITGKGMPMMINEKSISFCPWNPRPEITDEDVAELAASIRDNGLLNRLSVIKAEDGYIVFAGNRRLAACRLREAGEKLKAERAGGAYAGQGWTVYHAAVVADNETGQVSWFCERRHPGCRTRKPSRAAGGHLPSGGGLPSGTPSRADRGGCRTAVAGRGRRQERRPAASQARAQRRPAGG